MDGDRSSFRRESRWPRTARVRGRFPVGFRSRRFEWVRRRRRGSSRSNRAARHTLGARRASHRTGDDMTPAFASATDALERLRAVRVVPVITIDDPDDAVPLARALTDGGLACAEITFRTARAAEALRRITAEVPELFAGAGTVLTPDQAKMAREAGAQFIVAPGFSP